MDKRIVVPEGMLKASLSRFRDDFPDGLSGQVAGSLLASLEAALKWLSENPVVPTDEHMKEMLAVFPPHDFLKTHGFSQMCRKWQEIMFLAPEPVVPEEVKDLLVIGSDGGTIKSPVEEHNRKIIEAFNRGKRSK